MRRLPCQMFHSLIHMHADSAGKCGQQGTMSAYYTSAACF
jgi:hypothetical protein